MTILEAKLMIVELIKLVAEGEELFAVNVEYASGISSERFI